MIIKRMWSFFKRTIVGKLAPVYYAKSIGVSIGNDCILESVDFGSEPWLIEIGNHVEITQNVVFLTHDGATWVIRNTGKYKNVLKYGKIVLEDNCFVGNRSILLPGCRVGANSIIGAGSVVTGVIPPNTVAAGVPAKIICTTQEYAKKCVENMPHFDMAAYKRNKKAEVIRALDDYETCCNKDR